MLILTLLVCLPFTWLRHAASAQDPPPTRRERARDRVLAKGAQEGACRGRSRGRGESDGSEADLARQLRQWGRRSHQLEMVRLLLRVSAFILPHPRRADDVRTLAVDTTRQVFRRQPRALQGAMGKAVRGLGRCQAGKVRPFSSLGALRFPQGSISPFLSVPLLHAMLIDRSDP
jgi:hypothetical protein